MGRRVRRWRYPCGSCLSSVRQRGANEGGSEGETSHTARLHSFVPREEKRSERTAMGILKGKDTALEHIEKSKLAFLATLSEVEKGPSTNTMPPKDHFVLKFDRDSIKNLKGRVYETMKQYSYEQRGDQ